MREDYRSVRQTRADTSVSSLSGWLEKYGRPNREAVPEESQSCFLLLLFDIAQEKHCKKWQAMSDLMVFRALNQH